jgi:O-methyltransferase
MAAEAQGEAPENDRPALPLDDGAVLGEVDDATAAIVRRAQPHTMTGPLRLVALVDAVRYCVKGAVDGSFVECGVWRGGSVLTMAQTLIDLGAANREIYLYDTFEGMTEPTEQDTSPYQEPASQTWRDSGGEPWKDLLFDGDRNSVDAVRGLLVGSGYPEDLLRFVQGPVETTIPETVPESIALLRLDTDWYESTWHELEHLYPRLSPGGVLIIDDYGHWDGCRRAVDEYFEKVAEPVLLHRIDYAGRIAVKA